MNLWRQSHIEDILYWWRMFERCTYLIVDLLVSVLLKVLLLLRTIFLSTIVVLSKPDLLHLEIKNASLSTEH